MAGLYTWRGLFSEFYGITFKESVWHNQPLNLIAETLALRNPQLEPLITGFPLIYTIDTKLLWFAGPHVSKKERCLCGVPKGSVLGTLLFLLYINDIYNSSDKLSSYLFADDTNLLYADMNLRSLEITVNEELRSIGNWLMAYKLSLNVENLIPLFSDPIKRTDYDVNIKIYD